MEDIKFHILKNYAYLEALANIDDLAKNEELEKQRKLKEIREHFKNFFVNIREEMDKKKRKNDIIKTVKNKDFLQGHGITDAMKSDAKVEEETDIKMNGDSMLLRAMSINVRTGEEKTILEEFIMCLIEYFPDLICLEKFHTESKGVTPIHLAIVQGNVKLLNIMTTKLKDKTFFENEEITCAIGKQFYGTVMMAGTLLGIATLMCNETIFTTILYNFNTKMDAINEKGDNIIHSLVKYAHTQPEKLESLLSMLSFILDCGFLNTKTKELDKTTENVKTNMENEGKYRKQVGKLLMMKNDEELTPLQLAAKRQQYKIFEIVIKHEIYLSKTTGNGVFHENQYDITELETIAMANKVKTSHNEDSKFENHKSVLEYVLHHHTKNAFLFADVTPVKDVIKEKWEYYRPLFLAWFVIHFSFMVLLSVSALLRSRMEKSENANDTANCTHNVTKDGFDRAEYTHQVTKDCFVTFVSIAGLVFAILFILIEIARGCLARSKGKPSSIFWKNLKLNFSLPYSNCMFRFYFGLFYLLLIADFTCAIMVASERLPEYENYCLIFAVIIGWYLILFFLQAFKNLSFYTVLIQRVMLDILKTACIMVIFLIAFSIAMFMIMQGADLDQDDFDNFGKTIVKMVTIMLGIGEIDVLFQARQPILAVFVFLLFVVLTTILLLNALIAMMSNTCTDLTSNHEGFVASKMHYRLQKLSIILFIESFLPLKICKEVGEVKAVYRFDNRVNCYKKIERRFWTRNCIKGHGETDDISPDGSLELPENNINILKNELMKTIKKRQSKGKRKRTSKHKVSDLSSGLQTPTICIHDMGESL